VTDVLHIQDEQKLTLTLCGAWSRNVTLLGDDFDTDERSVCLRCTRRLIALRAHARLAEPQGAPNDAAEQQRALAARTHWPDCILDPGHSGLCYDGY